MKLIKKFTLVTTILLLSIMLFSCGGSGGGSGSGSGKEQGETESGTTEPGTTDPNVDAQTDAEAVEADAAALDINDIIFTGSDDASSVTGPFTLPTNGSSGTLITWVENSDPNNNISLSGSSGTVIWIESNGFGPYTVSLTAKVAKGNESTTKDFSVTVYPPATTKIETSADSIAFKMVLVPGGLSFMSMINDDGDINNNENTTDSIDEPDGTTISEAYWIADTEVTYEQWSAVYNWATDEMRGANRYNFVNTGQPFDYQISPQQYPVTRVSWRDALVWCNALTEWYNAQNGTSYACVYTSDAAYTSPIRTSTDSSEITASTDGSQDKPYVNPDAKGFRLPTAAEWSCAARYKGSDSTNGAYEFPASSGNWWTPGNYASGATADYTKSAETGQVSWYTKNSSYRSHVVGTAGNNGGAVRSGNANALDLYDMSGNVSEWNFDWSSRYSGIARITRGGSFDRSDYSMQVGYWNSLNPYNELDNVGFRFTRTQ